MKVTYTGEMNTQSIKKFCLELSKTGCYVTYITCFSEVIISKFSSLPSSVHAAKDWEKGYFYKGKHCDWSKTRKIRAENALNTKD